MSASDAVKRLAELVSLLGSEFRSLHAENEKLRNKLTAMTRTLEDDGNRNHGHEGLMENSGGSLLDREQLIARLEEMLDELAEIV